MSKITKILLIDDDEIFLKIAKIRFEKSLIDAVEIHTAKNNLEIKDKMKDEYDMIFIDLNMPETTGWQVIEDYNEKLKTKECKAFICSSSINPHDFKRADEMSDVIEKMISKPIDLEFVKSYLN